MKFNDLSDQSDRDEQKGFMMMFSGAVSGLRNPRAHGFINDDPERALEFIAFVSLLAKLFGRCIHLTPDAALAGNSSVYVGMFARGHDWWFVAWLRRPGPISLCYQSPKSTASIGRQE